MAFALGNGLSRKGRGLAYPTNGRDAGDLGPLSRMERSSDGIRDFIAHFRRPKGLHILDLGNVSQDTPAAPGVKGHHMHYASLLQSLDDQRSRSKSQDGDSAVQAANRFIRSYLDYPRHSFDAVLAWDVLQHLDEVTARVTIAYLSQIMRPNSAMFCIFHGGDDSQAAPILNCSVKSDDSLILREVGRRKRTWRTNIRGLECLFPQFRAVHFYLKRDSMFEVVVLS